MRTFNGGIIEKLVLHNFQTYSDAEFSFSSSLNFIAGPNGSGKSTIANAMALIFNGTPKTIGKAKEISEYIRFGQEEGFIEVHISFNQSKHLGTRCVNGHKQEGSKSSASASACQVNGIEEDVADTRSGEKTSMEDGSMPVVKKLQKSNLDESEGGNVNYQSAYIKGDYLRSNNNESINYIDSSYKTDNHTTNYVDKSYKNNNDSTNYSDKNNNDSTNYSDNSHENNNHVNTTYIDKDTTNYIDNSHDTTNYMDKDNNVLILKRIIKKNNQSLFYKNGKNCQKSEVDAIMQELGINVDNLCQFLPQEKVSEFTRLSPEKLLVEVLNSFNEKKLLLEKEKISALENEHNKIKEEYDSFLLQSISLGETVERLENCVKNYKEKQEKEKNIVLMNYKREWIYLKELQDQYRVLKDKINSHVTRFESLQAKRSAYLEKIEELKNTGPSIEFEKSCCALDKENDNLAEIYDNMKNLQHKLDVLEAELSFKQTTKENRTAMVEKKKEEIRSIEEEKGKVSIPDHPGEFQGEIDQLEEKLHEYKKRRSQIQYESSELKRAIDDLNVQKNKLSEFENATLELLKSLHPDTYRAVLWLRANTSEFEEEILEPPILQIRLKDRKFALEVENFLNFTALTTFICKNKRDFEKFARLMKDEKKYSINCFELAIPAGHKSGGKDDFTGSAANSAGRNGLNKGEYQEGDTNEVIEAVTGRHKSGVGINDLVRQETRKIGFEGMLIDFIECRAEIESFLNVVGGFNQIPITKKVIDQSKIFALRVRQPIAGEDAPEKEAGKKEFIYEIKKAAVNGRYLEIKKSKYNKDYLILDNPLKGRNIFSENFSLKELESINTELEEKDRHRKKNGEELRDLLKSYETVELQLKDQYELKKEHNNQILEIKKLEARMRMLNNLVDQKEKEIVKLKDLKEIESEVERLEGEKRKVVEEWEYNCELLSNHLTNKTYYKTFKETVILSREMLNINQNIKLLEEELNVVEREIVQTEQGLIQDKDALNKIKGVIQTKKGKLSKMELTEENRRAMESLPGTVEELDKRIVDEMTQVEFYNINTKALEEYDSKQQALKELKIKLKERSATKDNLSQGINDQRVRLAESIKEMMKPVSEKFSVLMEMFECEGRVDFVYENIETIKWRLNIMVRFRAGEDLEVLSGFRQSGGEKSVSTILFLLAIQCCKPAMFRLVDEINQGMDRHNEKLVHDLLVKLYERKINQKENSGSLKQTTPIQSVGQSQFFIITPKIVPNLTFSEQMKIFILYNGQTNLQHDGCTKYLNSIINGS